jgi:hypothetical protein
MSTRAPAAHRETRTMAKPLLLSLALAAVLLAGPGLSATAAPDAGETAVEPMRFETPDAAAMALIEAADTEGPDALHAVLGDGLDDLVSGDPVADAADRRGFVELAREAASIEDETDESALLVIGADDWPFPIPLARDARGWYFDTAGGVEELLDRRIGLNELHAIATARAFVDAQLEYAAADPDGDGTHAYAGRFWSSDGKRDGLYWPSVPGEPESPMGPLVAEAVGEGYSVRAGDGGPRPYHGYLFRLLDAQGPHAPGGARSYVTGAGLTGGVGLLAWPASYGNSGIMTFLVNQRGIVYEADLGEDTAAAAVAIDSYDPGDGWAPVTD